MFYSIMQVLLEITLSDWTPTNPNPFYKSLKLLFERGKDRDDEIRPTLKRSLQKTTV